MKKKNKKNLDILIPVYFEMENVLKTISLIIRNVKCNYKLHICYDTFKDPTINIIKKKYPKNNKINFIKNSSRGFNNALITGIKKTNGDAVIFYMADDTSNTKKIDKCYQIFNKNYQIVCPSRFIKGGKMEGNSFFKGLLTKLASIILYNFTNFPVKDATNSFRLFSRNFLKTIKLESQKGFTLSMEISAKGHRKDCNFFELPCTWIEREKGRSNFKLFSFIGPYLRWFYYIFNTSIFYKKNDRFKI